MIAMHAPREQPKAEARGPRDRVEITHAARVWYRDDRECAGLSGAIGTR